MPSKNKTSKKLVIVESPTKANTLSQFLGNAYMIEASYGHIRDLPKGDLGIDVDHGFEPRYVTPRDKLKLVNSLKKKCRDVSELYLAADPDREGEAIAWHVAQTLIDAKNPVQQVKRVVFHEITKEAIAEAFANPSMLNMGLVDAQKARRVLDRLVGYKLSPLLWKKIKRNLSAGRVQSVALRLIVEREREIEQFKPKEYWIIEVVFSDAGDQKKVFTALLLTKDGKKVAPTTQEESDALIADLRASAFSVSNYQQQPAKRSSPPPFITSTLQQTAANRLGFTAKRTMSAAQKLYEKGRITYMRTDSFNLAASALSKLRQFIKDQFAPSYLPENPRVFKNKSKLAQEAHEAIRPTDVYQLPKDLSGFEHDEVRLYELIWKRTVASQMESAVFLQQEIEVTGAGKSTYTLKAKGETLSFDGWLNIYGKDEEDADSEEAKHLPQFAMGDKLTMQSTAGKQKFTQPPASYTEATLIKALEEHGIGRPSTYAPIISTIQERLYVEKQDKKFYPTPIGFAVNDFLVTYFPDIVDLSFTAAMEESLDEIARGEKQWCPVISDFYYPFNRRLTEVEETVGKVTVKDEETSEVCEKCGKPMVIKVGRYGKFLACSGFPECKTTKPFSVKTGIKCPECGGDVIVRRTKKGRKFYGCSNYPNCKYASWYKPNEKAEKQGEKKEIQENDSAQ